MNIYKMIDGNYVFLENLRPGDLFLEDTYPEIYVLVRHLQGDDYPKDCTEGGHAAIVREVGHYKDGRLEILQEEQLFLESQYYSLLLRRVTEDK